MNRTVVLWLAVGWIGFAILPWYAIDDGFWTMAWFDGYVTDVDYAPGLFVALFLGREWLIPIGLALLAPLAVINRPKMDPLFSVVLLGAGGFGMAYTILQGFTVGLVGWNWEFLDAWFGAIEVRQFGMGYGSLLVIGAFLFLFAQGIAARGAINGDVFVVGSISLVIALVTAFIFFPVSRILVSAVQDNDENFAPGQFVDKLFSHDIWGLDCLTSSVGCGVAWNSLTLAVLTGAGTTRLSPWS